MRLRSGRVSHDYENARPVLQTRADSIHALATWRADLLDAGAVTGGHCAESAADEVPWNELLMLGLDHDPRPACCRLEVAGCAIGRPAGVRTPLRDGVQAVHR